jgi:hypothetical protein
VSIRYPTLLSLLSGGILAGGLALKPKEVKPAPSTYESQRLQEMTQRRALEDIRAAFTRVASNVKPNLLQDEQTGATAVVWENRVGLVPASGRAEDRNVRLRTPFGATVDGRLLPASGPLAALELNEPRAAVQVRRSLPSPGAWVVQVSLEDGGSFFTPGNYRGIHSVKCGDDAFSEADTSIALTDRMNGGGIFDLDGRLLAVLARCEGRTVALLASGIRPTVAAVVTPAERLGRQWGAKLDALDQSGLDYFAPRDGVFIRQLDARGAAADYGLQAGDLILTAGNEPVKDVASLAGAIELGKTSVDVWRTGLKRPLTIELSAPDSPVRLAGLVLESPAAGVEIGEVTPDSPAASSGIKPDDRLLSVDGSPVRDHAAVARLLSRSSGRARLLILQRGETRIGAFLP